MNKQIKSPSIYARLIAVMTEVKAINKDRKNAHQNYTFVSHDAVSKALHDPMVRNGIVFIPTVEELTQDGNRTSVKIKGSFINVDDPTDRLEVFHYGFGVDSQDKGPGKAVSYAVKYCLLKTFCLETGDDVEADNIDHGRTESEIALLESFIGDDIQYRNQVLGHLKKSKKISSFKELDYATYNKILEHAKARASEKETENLKSAEI